MRHTRALLFIILCVGFSGLLASVYWLSRSPLMASGRWERVDPIHLVAFAELHSLAPTVLIDEAVVTGFQDRIFRFRYRAADEAAFRALVEKRFVSMKDEGKIVLKAYSSFDERPGLPSWWPINHAALAFIDVHLLHDSPPGRSVMMMVGDGIAIGQIVEN